MGSSLDKGRRQMENPSVPQHAASQRLASLGMSFSLAPTFAYYSRAILQLEVRASPPFRSLANYENAGLQLPGLTHERKHYPT